MHIYVCMYIYIYIYIYPKYIPNFEFLDVIEHEFREKNDVFDKKFVLSFCIKRSPETSVFPVAIY